MKKSKLLSMMILITIIIFALTACSRDTADARFSKYKKAWENKEYEEMYSYLSKNSKEYIGKDEFIDRYTSIYKGMSAENIEINIKEKEEDESNIEFNLKMDTLAGEISLDDYKLSMIKEKHGDDDTWFVEWDESLIFPQMEKGDLVRVARLNAIRGEIFDRNGNGLAINGKRISVGIHPADYDDSNNGKLANILDIDEERIDAKLKKNINPEFFVPVVKLSLEDNELMEELSEIDGVRQQEISDRVYPGEEAFGSLIGYITPITAEQLEEDEEKIYNSRSLIGKFGLESVYEEHLRAEDGSEIYISKLKDSGGEDNISLIKKEPEDGKDLSITLDTELQKKIYEEMDGDVGASTAIDPKTGEVIAMVSFPSFDSNLYTKYISNSQKELWNDMDSNVFENKFNKVYSPGSTFKIITSAIALNTESVDPNEKINIEGKSWQNDSSWGNYKINRVSEKLTKLNLNDALIYSDNIYFAKAALEIGKRAFLKESKLFGFDEDLPISYPFEKSQIVNDKRIDNDILLADTGYGQGEILMSPLHLSLVYSMIVNNGNIMEPRLIKDDSFEVWKEDIVSEENNHILLSGFIDVIENKDGTGHNAKLEGIRLAGKTGTAELKDSQEEEGKENGWFVAMDVDNPNIVISTIIRDVEDRGGSNYIVPKVKNILEYYLSSLE